MESNYSEKLKFIWLSMAIIAILGAINVVLVRRVIIFNQYSGLVDSLEEVKKGTYSNKYQCLDFSSDLQKKLKKQGIDSQISIVEPEGKNNELHAVVSILIEPQTGKAVSYRTVDSCTSESGKLVCEKGMVEDKNVYVANRIEKE
ncbi:MAG: hypothetical protein WCO05_04635 [Candidatus Moraniibacteriota bacterium]